jgi:hypothetical protein
LSNQARERSFAGEAPDVSAEPDVMYPPRIDVLVNGI